MQKWEPGMTYDDFCNSKINVWVQIHRLPFELRNSETIKDFALLAGKVINSSMGSMNVSKRGNVYLRYHIKLDTSKPIVPGSFLKIIERARTLIMFKYENYV